LGTVNWRKSAIRVLSVLMAILLWVYVNNEQNPVNEQLISVPLHDTGRPESYAVGDMPSAVSVRYQVSRGRLTGLSESDFKATVDLSGVTEGEQSLPVEVVPPNGVQITQVSPSMVKIYVDRIVERQIPVVAAMKGGAAAGYSAMEPLVQPAVVTARGPGRILESINQFVITMDITAATGLIEKELPVSSGSKQVQVNPKLVKVTVPITPLPSKIVNVKPALSGSPADGYEAGEVAVQPGGVRIAAPSGILNGIDWLPTEPVDISGTKQDVNTVAKLVLPSGVSLVTPENVSVSVQIKPVKNQPATPDNEKPPGTNQQVP